MLSIKFFYVLEQEEIAKGKVEGQPLTWNDLSKMKYTWRVTMELLRLIPPVFGGFRQVLMDIEYEGYLIPKGWQARGQNLISIIITLAKLSCLLYMFIYYIDTCGDRNCQAKLKNL